MIQIMIYHVTPYHGDNNIYNASLLRIPVRTLDTLTQFDSNLINTVSPSSSATAKAYRAARMPIILSDNKSGLTPFIDNSTTYSFSPTLISSTIIPSVPPSTAITYNTSWIQSCPSITPTIESSTDTSMIPSNYHNLSISPPIEKSLVSVPSIDPSAEQVLTCNPTSDISNYPSTVQPSPYNPTLLPTYPSTNQPTFTLTSLYPSLLPSYYPSTHSPTRKPSTICPTTRPTFAPFIKATLGPTPSPTNYPTTSSPSNPTIKPSSRPTFIPSNAPTIVPTVTPTYTPSRQPSSQPSSSPTLTPTISKRPTSEPTRPTCVPTNMPSFVPTKQNSPLLFFFINITIANITKTKLSTSSELVISDSIAATMDISTDYVKYRYISNIQFMINNHAGNNRHSSSLLSFSTTASSPSSSVSSVSSANNVIVDSVYTGTYIIEVTTKVSLLLSSSPQYDNSRALYNHLIQSFQSSFNDGTFHTIFMHQCIHMNAHELNHTDITSYSISQLYIKYPLVKDEILSKGDITGIVIGAIAIIILVVIYYRYHQRTYNSKRDIRVYVSKAEEQKDIEIIMNSS